MISKISEGIRSRISIWSIKFCDLVRPLNKLLNHSCCHVVIGLDAVNYKQEKDSKSLEAEEEQFDAS